MFRSWQLCVSFFSMVQVSSPYILHILIDVLLEDCIQIGLDKDINYPAITGSYTFYPFELIRICYCSSRLRSKREERVLIQKLFLLKNAGDDRELIFHLFFKANKNETQQQKISSFFQETGTFALTHLCHNCGSTLAQYYFQSVLRLKNNVTELIKFMNFLAQTYPKQWTPKEQICFLVSMFFREEPYCNNLALCLCAPLGARYPKKSKIRRLVNVYRHISTLWSPHDRNVFYVTISKLLTEDEEGEADVFNFYKMIIPTMIGYEEIDTYLPVLAVSLSRSQSVHFLRAIFDEDFQGNPMPTVLYMSRVYMAKAFMSSFNRETVSSLLCDVFSDWTESMVLGYTPHGTGHNEVRISDNSMRQLIVVALTCSIHYFSSQ
eukprot:TRINITY_DN3003_c1_g1_i7.p1 TRINITY_DN3003_c1_g1~~TRINITY_DN3003_c1_g1_i7.p1  ORF type:complete len:378 (+),score=44.26 TRINITY_DN3003_c1_g1_i7:378-1511(+)